MRSGRAKRKRKRRCSGRGGRGRAEAERTEAEMMTTTTWHRWPQQPRLPPPPVRAKGLGHGRHRPSGRCTRRRRQRDGREEQSGVSPPPPPPPPLRRRGRDCCSRWWRGRWTSQPLATGLCHPIGRRSWSQRSDRRRCCEALRPTSASSSSSSFCRFASLPSRPWGGASALHHHLHHHRHRRLVGSSSSWAASVCRARPATAVGEARQQQPRRGCG